MLKQVHCKVRDRNGQRITCGYKKGSTYSILCVWENSISCILGQRERSNGFWRHMISISFIKLLTRETVPADTAATGTKYNDGTTHAQGCTRLRQKSALSDLEHSG